MDGTILVFLSIQKQKCFEHPSFPRIGKKNKTCLAIKSVPDISIYFKATEMKQVPQNSLPQISKLGCDLKSGGSRLIMEAGITDEISVGHDVFFLFQCECQPVNATWTNEGK